MDASLQPKKPKLLRSAASAARADLSRRGICFTMTASLLLLLLFGLAFVLVCSFAAFFLDLASAVADPVLIAVLYYLLEAVAFLLVVVPALLGRMRLCGLIATGGDPSLGEALYFFRSPRRYWRSVRLGLWGMLAILVPVGVGVGMRALSVSLYRSVFTYELLDIAADICLYAMLGLSAVLSAVLLLLAALSFATPALAVGNEAFSIRRCARMALLAGLRHKRTTLGFCLRLVWHALLSVLTLGLAYLFYYSHYNNLAYMRLSMALCPKGE